MKKFITILIVVVCGLWLFNHCSYCSHGKDDNDQKVLKQVRVAVQTANLRTGPGTSYDYVTVESDGTGGRWQVKRGTVLDVLAKEKGWYQVRIAGDSRTVYIKQSLCSDLAKGGKASRKEKKESVTDVRDSPAEAKQEKASSPASPSVDDVVEEVVGSKTDDDEVIF